LGFSKVDEFSVEHGNFGLLLLKETVEWLKAIICKWGLFLQKQLIKSYTHEVDVGRRVLFNPTCLQQAIDNSIMECHLSKPIFNNICRYCSLDFQRSVSLSFHLVM
jgi:hypothetical protein